MPEMLLGCEILLPLTDAHLAVLDTLQPGILKLRAPLSLSDLTDILDRYPCIREVVIRGISEQYATAEDCWNDIRDAVLTCLNRGLIVRVEGGNEPNHPDAPEGALDAAVGIVRDMQFRYSGTDKRILSIPLAAFNGPPDDRARSMCRGRVGETYASAVSEHVYWEFEGFGLPSWSGSWREAADYGRPVIVSELGESDPNHIARPDRRQRIGQVLQDMAADGRVHAAILFCVGTTKEFDYLNVTEGEAAYYRSLIGEGDLMPEYKFGIKDEADRLGAQAVGAPIQDQVDIPVSYGQLTFQVSEKGLFIWTTGMGNAHFLAKA